jgi:hypothetical protein
MVKTTVFLADLAEFGAMNEVYGPRFMAPYPARATVQVAPLPAEARVEIEAIRGAAGGIATSLWNGQPRAASPEVSLDEVPRDGMSTAPATRAQPKI